MYDVLYLAGIALQLVALPLPSTTQQLERTNHY